MTQIRRREGRTGSGNKQRGREGDLCFGPAVGGKRGSEGSIYLFQFRKASRMDAFATGMLSPARDLILSQMKTCMDSNVG